MLQGKEYTQPYVHKTVDVLSVLNETLTGQFAIEFGSVTVLGSLIIGLMIHAGLAHHGIILGPATFPFFLLPIGLLALSLFIPIFVLVLPSLVVAGNHGVYLRKQRGNPHFAAIDLHNLIQEFTQKLPMFLEE